MSSKYGDLQPYFFLIPSLICSFFNRCGCDDCIRGVLEDSLRHSMSRINSYRALSSPSLIALSSTDPILSAFELSVELKRLAYLETEFRQEYMVNIG